MANQQVKIWCGNSANLPAGYGRPGTPFECMRCGFGSAMMQYKWAPASGDARPPPRARRGCYRARSPKKKKAGVKPRNSPKKKKKAGVKPRNSPKKKKKKKKSKSPPKKKKKKSKSRVKPRKSRRR